MFNLWTVLGLVLIWVSIMTIAIVLIFKLGK